MWSECNCFYNNFRIQVSSKQKGRSEFRGLSWSFSQLLWKPKFLKKHQSDEVKQSHTRLSSSDGSNIKQERM